MSFVEELKKSENWLHDAKLIKLMKEYADNTLSNEKRTQLRKIYNQFLSLIRQAQKDDIEYKLQLLKARIAYANARKTIGANLYNAFCKIIDKISDDIPNNDSDFKKWLSDVRKFVEAFYAYGYVSAESNNKKRRTK